MLARGGDVYDREPLAIQGIRRVDDLDHFH
jgi:hypothetical protein